MIVAPSSASSVRLRGWMVTFGMEVASYSILAWPPGVPPALAPGTLPSRILGAVWNPARQAGGPMQELPIGASDEMTITTTPEMGVAHLPVPMYSTPAMVAHFEG